jgi:predicted transcriptional regulator
MKGAYTSDLMQNRQKDEIVRDILAVCNGGSLITRVMFHAYITHTQAKGYLSELIEKGLVETDIFNSKKYFATSKGIEYLAGLERMSEMLAIETRTVKSDMIMALG